MKIGYSVEGSTDRALITGLKERWCPRASLEEGRFRGTSGESLRRDFRRICDVLSAKGADIMVFLTDANDRDWRQVQKDERAKFPNEWRFRAIQGVADRNIECWLCAEPDWLGNRLGVSPAIFRTDDPKGVFEHTLGISRDDKKESEIASLVREAPLRSWLQNVSFEGFYQQVWNMSKQHSCTVENLRESQAG